MGHIEIIHRLEKENEALKKRVDALEKRIGKSKPKDELREGKIAEHKLLKTEGE